MCIRDRANTEFKSDVGRSALTTASQCGHVAVVHELLEARAAIETLALRYAVTHGHEEIVQCLLHELQAQGDLKAGLREELVALAVKLHQSQIGLLLMGPVETEEVGTPESSA